MSDLDCLNGAGWIVSAPNERAKLLLLLDHYFAVQLLVELVAVQAHQSDLRSCYKHPENPPN